MEEKNGSNGKAEDSKLKNGEGKDVDKEGPCGLPAKCTIL